MSRRAQHTAIKGLAPNRRAARYIESELDPIGRAVRRLVVTEVGMYAAGVVLTLLGCVLAVVNPVLMLTMLGGAQYIACGMGLTALVYASYVGCRIWQYGTALNRLGLLVAPLGSFLLVWYNKSLVMSSTDALGGVIFGLEGARGVRLLLVFLAQAVMWGALFALPVLVVHGLGINKRRLNKAPHRLTETKTGQGQAVFWHFVCGYAVAPLAWAAWLPFFVTLF